MRLFGLRAAVVVFASIVVGATLAGCRREEPAPSVESPPRGSSSASLNVAGRDRAYRLYVPPELSLAAQVALVVMLHGGFGSAAQAEQAYGWNDQADRYGFVVAYPDGLNRAWAAGGGCCGEAGRDGVDDVGFITAVVANVGVRLPVDPDRIFATGMSNGGVMSYRLACDSTLFAAIAPVAATMMGDCPAPRPLSLLHIHGLADERVRFDGDPGNGLAQVDGPDVTSVVDSWRSVGGCAPSTTSTAGRVTTAEATCPEGRAVVLVTVAGAGHEWPGRIAVSDGLDATGVIWRFFAAHPRR
jgi:polyhydroxybutyrate depolymerase